MLKNCSRGARVQLHPFGKSCLGDMASVTIGVDKDDPT